MRERLAKRRSLPRVALSVAGACAVLVGCSDGARDVPPGAVTIDAATAGNDDGSPPPVGTGLPMMRQRGRDWTADGEVVRLRGVNLGNWLQMEFWMMGGAITSDAGTIGDQCTLEAVLDERFGYAERERLLDAFRDSWMTDRDWDRIAALGFNLVRLPFPHHLLENEHEPFTLRPDAWEYLDRAIAEASDRGIYTILDLHGAPGSQGWEHHSGCAGRNWYWDGGDGRPSDHYQARAAWLWEQIAERYAGNGSVAAYGLLNEPWGTDGVTLSNNLTSLYHAVRAVDPDHVIILHGHNATGIEHLDIPGNDVAYEMHFYPGIFGWRNDDDPTQVHIDWLFCHAGTGPGTCDWDAQIDARQIPFLIGEFQPWTELGPDAGDITRKTYDVYNGLGWAATGWSYKTTSLAGEDGTGDNGWPWGVVTNTAGYASIDVSTASAEDIEAWFRQFASQPIATHDGVQQWMTYQPTAGGDRIEAEHFIQHAGADIEVTADPQGGHFNAAYLDDGDWMVYEVTVPASGAYRLQYRVASPGGGLVGASIRDGAALGETTILATGDWQTWQDLDGPTVHLDAGVARIRLDVVRGGWNLNYWRLVAASDRARAPR